MDIDQLATEAGITLPPLPEAAADYRPWKICDNWLFVAGQTPKIGNQLMYTGQLGKDLSVAEGKKAAELCALRIIRILKELYEKQKLTAEIVKVTVYVNACASFCEHSQVADGASSCLKYFLNQSGVHPRTAVGVSSLPNNACVEVDCVARLVNFC